MPSMFTRPRELRDWLLSVQTTWLSIPADSRSSENYIVSRRWRSSRSRCTCYTASLALVRRNGPIPIFLNCNHCVLHREMDGSTDTNLSGKKENVPWHSSTIMGEMRSMGAPRYYECATDTHANCLSREALDGGTQTSLSSPPITPPVIGSPTILQPWQLFREGVPAGSSLSESMISTSDMEYIQIWESLMNDNI